MASLTHSYLHKAECLCHSFLAFNSFHWTLWNSAVSIIRGKFVISKLSISSNSSRYVFFNFLLFQKTGFPLPRLLLLIQPSHVGIFLFTHRPDTLTELKVSQCLLDARFQTSLISYLSGVLEQTWAYSWESTVHGHSSVFDNSLLATRDTTM